MVGSHKLNAPSAVYYKKKGTLSRKEELTPNSPCIIWGQTITYSPALTGLPGQISAPHSSIEDKS
jgi:predicted alternative tryptophan synthase beta-subunit